MPRHTKSRTTKSFERALAAGSRGKYVLRLYVAGATERSRRALARARHLCDVELKGRCDLEVIDVYQQPILALDGQIVATPTLVKEFPLPVRPGVLFDDLVKCRECVLPVVQFFKANALLKERLIAPMQGSALL